METPSFPDYPTLNQLIYRHTPGFDYAIVLAGNVAKFTEAGWKQVQAVPPFLVKGQTMLLFRKGEQIWGANSEDSLPHFYVDTDADKATGTLNPTRLTDRSAKEHSNGGKVQVAS